MITINIKHTLRALALLAGFSIFTLVADAQSADNDSQKSADQNALDQPGPEQTSSGVDEDHCIQEYASEDWIDKTQANAYTSMCKTVKWFDGLFGKGRKFNDNEFGGKISIGFKQTERDGFDEKVRLRIKTKLPNISSRANAFVGRGDESAFVSDSDQDPGGLAETAVRRQIDEESEWLVGLGFSNPKDRRKGFDFSIGAKISSGLNPYTRLRYRYQFKLPANHIFRASQTIFWRNDEGYGTTSNLNYSYLLGLNDILQWGFSGKFTEEEDQWEWVNSTNWYHRLKNDHAIVTRAFLRGEEENTESLPEYGISLTYRRPFLREWVFLEGLVEHRWFRDSAAEPREGSLGAGLAFIMEFGHIARKRLDQK